ncbi:hypothetical protein [Pseudomonas mangrovi]|uniref:Uncharacterized protein n=1 Tax=Pseudomonas mangrovi TaxID=2161748 RepID=A0A2T5P5Q3_9PSED|nr:hypothetical protein [Pseudomonas mangrovi]PTU73044.1 hypothetical protein DBO85_17515 [Pseudomonas mangrovi]
MSRLLALLLIALSSPALAQDCPYVPGKSLCGLPLDAGRARFEALLGEPDGELRMGPGRTGLLFGHNFLLVMGNDRVEQVHSWSRSNLDFLDQVRNGRQDNPLHLTLGDFNPWSRSRQQVGLALQSQPPVAADEFSELRVFDGAQFYIEYASVSGDPRELGEWSRFQVEQIRLTLKP